MVAVTVTRGAKDFTGIGRKIYRKFTRDIIYTTEKTGTCANV